MIRRTERFEPNLLHLIIGGALIVLGSMVLIGWHTHTSVLIQISPEFAPMQPNTALCFLFSGIAIFLSRHSPKISGLLGALILAFSLTILSQYIFHVNYGIDTLFSTPYLNSRTIYPGRIAPNTAISFCLAGLMFLSNGFLKDRKLFSETTLIIPILIFILAFVAFLGYVTNISSAYTWGPFAGMALHTSCGFILLSLPSFPRIYYEIKKSIITNNYFLAAVIFFSGITLFLILTQIIMSKAETYFEDKIKNDAIYISEKMLVLIKEDLEAVERLFLRLNHNYYQSTEVIKDDAEMYIKQSPEVSLIVIHRPDKPLILRQQNINAATEEKLIADCQKKSPLINPALSTRIYLSISGTSMCVKDSAAKNLVVINLSSMVSTFLSGLFTQKYYLELTSGDKKIYQNLAYFDTISPNFYYSNSFIFYNVPLKLNLYVRNASYSEIYGWLIFPFFFFGIFLSALISIVIHLWQGGRLSAERLKKTLAAKQESEEILKHIVSSSPGAILIAQKNDTLSFFNEKALELWGYTHEEFTQQSIGDLMPERFRAAHAQFRKKYYQNPKLIPLGARDDLCILKKSGKEIPVELELNPMKIRDEIQILCTFMDISLRKQNEAQLKKYTENLKRSNEALHDFAYIASHDLKEPLRGISNYSAFLMEDYADKLDQDGRDKLQTLQKLAKRMGDLIETLLLYSRVGSLDLQLKSLAIQPIIQEKLELLGPFLKEKNAVVTCLNDLPTLTCDAARIGEVFQNLITNAVKYNDRDQKIIHISSKEEINTYIFSVHDNGIGIAEENFEKIFKIFKRLHGHNEYGGGTGAGMTIIKKIIERHGGKIWLESKVGEGTTFYFSISKHLQAHEGESKGEN